MSKEWHEYVPFESAEDREGLPGGGEGVKRNFKEDFLEEEDIGTGRGIMHRGWNTGSGVGLQVCLLPHTGCMTRSSSFI